MLPASYGVSPRHAVNPMSPICQSNRMTFGGEIKTDTRFSSSKACAFLSVRLFYTAVHPKNLNVERDGFFCCAAVPRHSTVDVVSPESHALFGCTVHMIRGVSVSAVTDVFTNRIHVKYPSECCIFSSNSDHILSLIKPMANRPSASGHVTNQYQMKLCK